MFAKPTVRTAFAVMLAFGLILALPGPPANAAGRPCRPPSGALA